MKEVKTPKKPLAYYYGIVLIVLIVFNLVVTPILMKHQVKETDYGTFMSMIEKKNIGEVEVKDNQIIFTDKDQKNIYKTGLMNDPNLTDRLYECGAVFAKDIDKQMSPIISFLLTGILPLILFIALGNYMAKKLMEHAGGKNSMAFGMGKSNAKIYVQSSEGIRFSDVAGEDEAKENLSEIVDYLHNPKKYTDVGASMPKGVLLVGPPGTGKTMLAKAVAGESNVPFSQCPDQNLLRCLSVWELPKFEIFSDRQRKRHHVSCLLMKLMPLVKSVTDKWAEMMRGSRP